MCTYLLSAVQDGASRGEPSQADLILNFILKVRVLRFLRPKNPQKSS